MGRLITTAIANLISGVSQQPWSVRLPTQAEEQVNCYSSVTDFLKRRPATRHLAELPAPEGDAAAGVAAAGGTGGTGGRWRELQCTTGGFQAISRKTLQLCTVTGGGKWRRCGSGKSGGGK